MEKHNGRVRIGVIGLGQWGPNHVRNLSAIDDCEVQQICDQSRDKIAEAHRQFRGIAATPRAEDVIGNPDIDAVVIATPSATHFRLASAALRAGKHVLCEKPLATEVRECRALAELARRTRRVLMVGHVFLYNPSVRFLREALRSGEFGRIYYVDAIRTNLGPVRRDVGAIHDLASHDISIFNYLLGSTPVSVSANASAILQKGVEDVAFLTLRYPDNIVCHAHASWLNPRKVRQLTIVGDKKMAVWDDMNNLEPIRFYDKGVVPAHYSSFGEFQMVLRDGQITIPKLKLAEPLRLQDGAFIEAIRTARPPDADVQCGLDVVRVLDAARRSLARHGRAVPLSP